jgi:hypothetical protein
MSERGRKGKAGGGPAKQERADIWMGRARVRERKSTFIIMPCHAASDVLPSMQAPAPPVEPVRRPEEARQPMIYNKARGGQSVYISRGRAPAHAHALLPSSLCHAASDVLPSMQAPAPPVEPVRRPEEENEERGQKVLRMMPVNR